MPRKTIHVAAENPLYRESLRQTLQDYDIGDVVLASDQGALGVEAARFTQPSILIVSTSAEDDTIAHLHRYRQAAPDAYLIGFAFNEEEARHLAQGGVDRVVMSGIDRQEMLRVLQEADARTERSGTD